MFGPIRSVIEWNAHLDSFRSAGRGIRRCFYGEVKIAKSNLVRGRQVFAEMYAKSRDYTHICTGHDVTGPGIVTWNLLTLR
jgi:hypothetical protein